MKNLILLLSFASTIALSETVVLEPGECINIHHKRICAKDVWREQPEPKDTKYFRCNYGINAVAEPGSPPRSGVGRS